MLPDCESCGRPRQERYGITRGTCRRCVHERDALTRLQKHYEVTPAGCWEWTRYRNAAGYGEMGVAGRKQKAHRVAYELLIGPIPRGLTLDHLCRNRACVNPAHLEPVTRGENVLRGDTLPAARAAQTHCKHGHAFTPENTYRAPGRPRSRVCRACLRRTHNDQEVAA